MITKKSENTRLQAILSAANEGARDGVSNNNQRHIKISGRNFKIMVEGEELDEVMRIDCAILAVSKKMSAYYEKQYSPESGEQVIPNCFSSDCIMPSNACHTPEAENCASCRWSKFGSDLPRADGSLSKGRRCREYKMMVVYLLDPKIEGDKLFKIKVPRTSLKALAAYYSDKNAENKIVPYLITTIAPAPKLPYMQFTFTEKQEKITVKLKSEIDKILLSDDFNRRANFNMQISSPVNTEPSVALDLFSEVERVENVVDSDLDELAKKITGNK